MASSWKKQRIQDHFVALCNELDVDRIVPVLRVERMLTNDEHEQLTNRLYTTRIRREKLLLFIPYKGKNHFEKFVECLVWSGQADLARKMGVPVQEIRPSPHPPIVQSSLATQQQDLLRMMQIISGVPSSHSYCMGSNTAGNLVHSYPQSNHIPHTNPAPQIHSTHVTHPTQSTLPSLATPYPIQESNPAGGCQQMSTEPPPQPVVLPHTAAPIFPSRPAPAAHTHIATTSQRGPCKNVFILYCNEEEIQGTDDLSEFVRELADFLTRTCGQMMKIHCDMYVTNPPPSWPQWTEELIHKSDCVLYVCSKSLNERLSSSGTNRSVQMKLGSFDATTVYHLIESPKFVPVFFNTNSLSAIPNLYDLPYKSWIPANLLGASRYWLDLESLHRSVGETTTEQEYQARLTQVLEDERINKSIQPIANMLRFLQGAPDTQAPPPFPTPIVPPAGTANT